MSSMESKVKSATITRSGVLAKRGTGYLFKPWTIRLFKLYGKYGVMTYEGEEGDVKGIVKLENAPIRSIPDSDSDGRKFAMRIIVRKLKNNFEVDESAKEINLDCACSSLEDKKEWMKALTLSIHRAYTVSIKSKDLISSPVSSVSTPISPITSNHKESVAGVRIQSPVPKSPASPSNLFLDEEKDIIISEKEVGLTIADIEEEYNYNNVKTDQIYDDNFSSAPKFDSFLSSHQDRSSTTKAVKIDSPIVDSAIDETILPENADRDLSLAATGSFLDRVHDPIELIEEITEPPAELTAVKVLQSAAQMFPSLDTLSELIGNLFELTKSSLCYADGLHLYAIKTDHLMIDLFDPTFGAMSSAADELSSSDEKLEIFLLSLEEFVIQLTSILCNMINLVRQLSEPKFIFRIVNWRHFLDQLQQLDCELSNSARKILQTVDKYSLNFQKLCAAFEFRVIAETVIRSLTLDNAKKMIQSLNAQKSGCKEIRHLAKELDCEEGILIEELTFWINESDSLMSSINLSTKYSSAAHPYQVIKHVEFQKFWASNFSNQVSEKMQVFLHKLLDFFQKRSSFTENQCIDLIARYSAVLTVYDHMGSGAVTVSSIYQMTRQFPTNMALVETVSKIIASCKSEDDKLCYHVILPFLQLPVENSSGSSRNSSADSGDHSNSDDDDDDDQEKDDRTSQFRSNDADESGFSYSIYSRKTMGGIMRPSNAFPIDLNETLYGSRFDQIEINAKMTSTIGWLCVDGPRRCGKTTRVLTACKDLGKSRSVLWFEFQGFHSRARDFHDASSFINQIVGADIRSSSTQKSLREPNFLFSLAAAQLGIAGRSLDSISSSLSAYLDSLGPESIIVIDGVPAFDDQYQGFFDYLEKYAIKFCIVLIFTSNDCDAAATSLTTISLPEEVGYTLRRGKVVRHTVEKLSRKESQKMVRDIHSFISIRRNDVSVELSKDDVHLLSSLADDTPGYIQVLCSLPITLVRQMNGDSIVSASELLQSFATDDDKKLASCLYPVAVSFQRFDLSLAWALARRSFNEDASRWQIAFQNLKIIGWIVSLSEGGYIINNFLGAKINFNFNEYPGSPSKLQSLQMFLKYWATSMIQLQDQLTICNKSEELMPLLYFGLDRHYFLTLFKTFTYHSTFLSSINVGDVRNVVKRFLSSLSVDIDMRDYFFDVLELAGLTTEIIDSFLELHAGVISSHTVIAAGVDDDQTFILDIFRAYVRLNTVSENRDWENEEPAILSRYHSIVSRVNLSSALFKSSFLVEGLDVIKECMVDLADFRLTIDVHANDSRCPGVKKVHMDKLFADAYLLKAEILVRLSNEDPDLGENPDDDTISHLLNVASTFYLFHDNFHFAVRAYKLHAANLAKKGLFDDAIDLIENCIELIQSRSGNSSSVEISNLLFAQAEVSNASGKISDSITMFQKSIDIRRSCNINPIELIEPLKSLGKLYIATNGLLDAKECYESALDILETHLGAEHVSTAVLLHSLGDLSINIGDFDTAKQYLDKSLSIFMLQEGSENAEVADVLYSLSQLNIKTSKPEIAKVLLDKVTAIRAKVLGPNDPQTIKARQEHGTLSSPNRRRSILDIVSPNNSNSGSCKVNLPSASSPITVVESSKSRRQSFLSSIGI